MRLTTEEYQQGVISWSPAAKAQVRTLTADDPSDDGKWSEPLNDPNGSKVISPPSRYVQLGVEPDPGSSSPYPLRWDRLAAEGAVQALILDPVPHHGQMIQLAHIPGYGTFHRLVVAVTESLTWDDDAVVRVGDAIVRLVTGKVVGERVSPLNQVEGGVESVSITSKDWTGTVELEGRFIEVVAPGADPAAAELAASAILGLVALMFGAGVVGRIVLSEPWRAAPGIPQEGTLRIPVSRELPRSVENEGLEAIDRVLESLFGEEPMMQALRLALHWFERGVRSRASLDELISFFIGIEAILNTYSSVHGPIREVAERKKNYSAKVRRLLKGEVDGTTLGLIQQTIGRATTRDRFAFYVERRGLSRDWIDKFESLADVRNKALHGQPLSVTPRDAATALDLLTELLKRELALEVSLPWQSDPMVTSMSVTFQLATYGYHGH